MKFRSWWGIRLILWVLTGLALVTVELVWANGQQASSVFQSYLKPMAFSGPDKVVVVGEPVEFFGQGASADDEIVAYAWDFESDGVQDFVSTHTGYTVHRFSIPGDYQCVLTVRDSFGRVARDSRRIIAVVEKIDSITAQQMLQPSIHALSNPPDGVKHIYAIMINGGYEIRFWRDVELGYDMLTNGYGFSPNDIYLLNYKGTDPYGGNPDGMIDYWATEPNLQTVFNELVFRADADDELFIWITDHGHGYSGPLSRGGLYLGYLDGRASVDPGDEPDFNESDFKLRSIFTGGDYICNHGMDVWKVFRKYYSGRGYLFYRNKYVSKLHNVYIESEGGKVSDNDIYIERLVDYALGDANQDGYINTDIGEVFDFDGDGNPPFNHTTGEFDEGDWGEINILEDNYNRLNTKLPVDGHPYQIFDEGNQSKICIDLGYTGGDPEVDGRDEDNAGLFDWMDVNQDGDTLDIVSVDEAICLYSGDLYDDELAELLNQLSVAKVTIAALPCFSGGLVEDISSPNRIICTATIEDAVSWGDLFIRGFVAALHGESEDDSPVDADTNGNGYVSMLEAFNYAAGNDFYDEIPQYDDNGDGFSHTDPVPAGGDGTLGCNTYLTDVIVGNFDGDIDVDFIDYKTLAAYWMETECEGCGGVDLNCDTNVDFFDLREFIANWLAGLE
jgi:PKD repeat protein